MSIGKGNDIPILVSYFVQVTLPNCGKVGKSCLQGWCRKNYVELSDTLKGYPEFLRMHKKR
jgi:hypothetical protein